MPLLGIYLFTFIESLAGRLKSSVPKGPSKGNEILVSFLILLYRTKPLQQLTIKSAALQRQADRPQAGGDWGQRGLNGGGSFCGSNGTDFSHFNWVLWPGVTPAQWASPQPLPRLRGSIGAPTPLPYLLRLQWRRPRWRPLPFANGSCTSLDSQGRIRECQENDAKLFTLPQS